MDLLIHFNITGTYTAFTYSGSSSGVGTIWVPTYRGVHLTGGPYSCYVSYNSSTGQVSGGKGWPVEIQWSTNRCIVQTGAQTEYWSMSSTLNGSFNFSINIYFGFKTDGRTCKTSNALTCTYTLPISVTYRIIYAQASPSGSAFTSAYTTDISHYSNITFEFANKNKSNTATLSSYRVLIIGW